MNSENNNIASTDSDQISLKELFCKIGAGAKYLLSKWRPVLFFVLLGGIVGFFYAKNKKPIYSAVTTFVLEEEESGVGLGSLAGLASIAGVNLGNGGGGIFRGDNILELYKSRAMIEKTLLTEVSNGGKNRLLIDWYIDFNGMKESWGKSAKLKGFQFKNTDIPDFRYKRLRDSILRNVVNDINKNYLKVDKPDKALSIIKAEVTAPNEFFAKMFNEQIVKNVNDFYVQTKTRKSLDNVTILQQKTDSVLAIMNGAIYKSVAISDATPNLNPTRQIQRAAPMQRSQVTIETNKAVLSELVKNLELSKISLRKETPLIQVIDEPVLPLEVSKLGPLKAIILGGILFGFFTVLFLLTRKIFKQILK